MRDVSLHDDPPPTTLAHGVAAELVGTALLLAAVAGSGIMGERLAGGSAGLALLANALATGAALVALILTFAPISGAQFNPLVTVALALEGLLPRGRVLPFVAAQVAGAVAGVWLAHLMFDLPILQASLKLRSGVGQWAGEAVATFGLLLLVLVCVRRNASAIPYAVASYIVGAYWFTSSTSFANPAVALARALSDTFAGIAPASVPGFVLAEATGAGLALAFARWLLAPPRLRAATRA
jgi:glycerol uptake facilitator-like aquaporin